MSPDVMAALREQAGARPAVTEVDTARMILSAIRAAGPDGMTWLEVMRAVRFGLRGENYRRYLLRRGVRRQSVARPNGRRRGFVLISP